MGFCRGASVSGTLIAPVANFFEAFATGLLEQADTMADVLKFMNIGPHLSQPMFLMNRGFTAGGAAGVKPADQGTGWRIRSMGRLDTGQLETGKLDEDAPYLLDVFVGVDDVLVAQQEAKSQLAGFRLGLGTGLKGSVFGSQLFDGVTC